MLALADKQDLEQQRHELYSWLMARQDGMGNSDLLARLYSSWTLGQGVLPDWMGLRPEEFRAMMALHFPSYQLDQVVNPGRLLDTSRAPESEDLLQLLYDGTTTGQQSELWMAQIVVAGCMGSDHLWQDLGLWSRTDLSRLMMENFEPLASRNTKDMKWKKFLYKQLCDAEGIYVCRAPSCEVCTDYVNRYGS